VRGDITIQCSRNLTLVSDGKDEHRVCRDVVFIESDATGFSGRDKQFAQPVLHRSSKNGMQFQSLQAAGDDRSGGVGQFRRLCEQEMRKPVEIV
jgi:hypothetical protein